MLYGFLVVRAACPYSKGHEFPFISTLSQTRFQRENLKFIYSKLHQKS